MPRQLRKGGEYQARGNMTTCPACGSHCSTTEANHAAKMIDGESLEDAQVQVKALDLRIAALEAELDVAKRAAKRALAGRSE